VREPGTADAVDLAGVAFGAQELEKEVEMKTMTCEQLGGPCTRAFQGNSADEVIKAQDVHLKEVVAAGDEAHKDALKAMQGRWRNPIRGMGWYMKTKRTFSGLPED
jgi:hypothetical protein